MRYSISARGWLSSTSLLTLLGCGSTSAPTPTVASSAVSAEISAVVVASGAPISEPAPKGSSTPFATLSGHEAKLNHVAFSADGAFIVTSGEDGGSRVWAATGGAKPAGQLVATLPASLDVRESRFTSDGRFIVAANWSNVNVWNIQTQEVERTLSGGESSSHGTVINAIDLTRDGGRVLSASADSSARVWDFASGKPVSTFGGHNTDIVSGEFSPDGQRVVTVGPDAKLWTAATGKLLSTLAHDGQVWGARFSPDGERVVTANEDGTGEVWDARTGARICTLTGHADTVHAASFSPDGAMIATASRDKTARLWDSKSCAELHKLEHPSAMLHVTFSHSGRLVLTAGVDGVASVWSAKGELLQSLDGHKDTVVFAAFSPDDKIIATASHDQTAKLWKAP